jgi:2-polyprenyl-6-methoxyphenol hydroxylase-like FAD-dependent oxidoreductase
MAVNKVLVVGAGVGGLGAAAALGQRGVQVDVVETKPDATVLGVGINQPGNSLRALDELGVLQEVLDVGFAFDGNEFRDWQDNLIIFVPSILGNDRVPANAALTRPNLHRILKGAAERAGASIRYGVTVESLEDDGDGVDVTFSDGTSDRYDIVGAFDGVKSAMRTRLFGSAFDPQYTGYGIWRLQLDRPDDVTRTLVYQGSSAKAGLIPLSQEFMYMFLVVPEPGNPHHDAADFGDLLKQRLAGFGGKMGEIRDAITGPEGIVYSPLIEVVLPRPWHKGRVIVLGDAAHTAAPHLTQGAGMALEDAIVFAEQVTSDLPLEEALTAVSDIRFDRAKLVFDVSHAILEGEMQVTTENMPYAVAGMRAELPGQTAFLESQLNLSFHSPAPQLNH